MQEYLRKTQISGCERIFNLESCKRMRIFWAPNSAVSLSSPNVQTE